MTSFEHLSNKLQKKCKPRRTEHGILSSDMTVRVNNETYFLTNVFKDGSFLGFWSHSPWGRSRNQEQGWVVLSPNLEILDSCETRTSGMPAGNDFRKWRKQQTQEHGKSSKIMYDFGEQMWKMSDC